MKSGSEIRGRKRQYDGVSSSPLKTGGDAARQANTTQVDSVARAGTSLIRIDVSPIKYAGSSFPSFRKPTEVASFSLDINRSYLNDRSMLKRLASPSLEGRVNFDLNEGYSTFDKRDETVKENLDDILRCILLNKRLLGDRDRSLADFVCWRGLLTKVLCTPYETRDGWTLAVCKLGSTIYLCECDKSTASHPNMDLMTYWGYKFEQYMTVRKGASLPDNDESVNNKEAFCSVVASRLGKHSLLYGGEVDCCSPRDASHSGGDAPAQSDAVTDCSYVELKTNRDFDHAGQERNFRKFKVLKWWAQSFLLAVPTVVCGFRDDAGVVHRLCRYTTLELPRLVRGERDMWDPAVCFNFLGEFLSLVKNCMTTDEFLYVFEFSPGTNFVQGRAYPSDNKQYSFLPDWYRNSVFSYTP